MDDAGHKGKSRLTSREVLYSVLTYLAMYVFSLLLLIALIRLPLFRNIRVFLYRGTVMIILAGILTSLSLWLFIKVKKAGWLSFKDIVLVFFFVCCINMVMLVVVPVTVERSISVFMLSYMDANSDKTYTPDEIAEVFVDKYVEEYDAFGKRFYEQATTGSISENPDGSYSITSKGHFLVKMFRFVASVFDVDERLVSP